MNVCNTIYTSVYPVLLQLHLNILAYKMSQIFGLSPPDGHTVISCLNQAVINIHNVTHKVVLLHLSQSISEQWKTLAKIIHFDQCTEVDNVHQILFNYRDADEWCCEVRERTLVNFASANNYYIFHSSAQYSYYVIPLRDVFQQIVLTPIAAVLYLLIDYNCIL